MDLDREFAVLTEQRHRYREALAPSQDPTVTLSGAARLIFTSAWLHRLRFQQIIKLHLG